MSQKIALELPDWADERNIHVLAGIEEVAYKLKDGPWMVKVGRCNLCGQCCMQMGKSHPFRGDDGRCIHLAKEVGNNPRWICALGPGRPLGCCVATPEQHYCTVSYKEV